MFSFYFFIGCGQLCLLQKLKLPTLERHNSGGYTRLLPEVTQWVIALGWDRFGFLVRLSPLVTL